MKFKKIQLFFLIYLIAHVLSLLIFNTKFYDDIWLYSVNKETLINYQDTHGDYFNHRSFIYIFFLKFNQYIVIFFSFILFFTSSILLYFCLIKYFDVDKSTIDLFIILYLVLPFGSSIKLTLMSFPYLIYLNFFLIGWILMKHNRILSIFFFLLSFNLQSLLCLFAVPFLSYYFLKEKNFIKREIPIIAKFKHFIKFSFKNIEFTVLPFLFYILKQFYFPTYGLSINYNKDFSYTHLITTPILQSLDLFRNNLSIGFILIGFLITLLLFIKIFKKKFNFKNNFNYLIVISAVFFSLFPYWILNETPTFSGFSSRHQILMALSFPFMIIYIINKINIRYQKIILIFIFTLSLGTNFKIYSDYLIESIKQKKFIVFIRNNKEILSEINLIMINDKTKNPTISYYQSNPRYFNGLFKLALNNEKNFVINISEKENYFLGKYDEQFNKIEIASEHIRKKISNIYILNIESHGFLKYEFNFFNDKLEKINLTQS